MRQNHRTIKRVLITHFLMYQCTVVLIAKNPFLCRYAYVEFTDKEAAEKALELDDSTFKGRQLKVMHPSTGKDYH